MSSLYDLLQRKGNISSQNGMSRSTPNRTQQPKQSQQQNAAHAQPLPNIPRRWAGEIQRIAFFLSSQADTSDSRLSVTFASLQRGTGTTTISYLIANYLAAEQSSKHVLYIDHAPSNRSKEDYGSGNFITVGDTDISRLFGGDTLPFNRITIFPDNNISSPVSSRWFREFMDEAKKTYQIIIADTPPFSQEPGSYSLAMATDGVVLILQAGDTRYPAVNTLVMDLEDLGIQTLGAVLNKRRYPIPQWLIRLV